MINSFGFLCQDRMVVFLSISFLGLLVYLRSFFVDFTFDDYGVIVNNPLIKNFDLEIFWQHYKTRFLTNLSFVLNYQIHGLDIFGWHLLNLIIHMGNSFWAYLLTNQLLTVSGKGQKGCDCRPSIIAFFVSLIFLLHPIQTQAVTYIVQRATLLATFFYLSAVYCFVRSFTENKYLYLFIALFCALLGMFTKPIIITLPVILVLLTFLFPKMIKAQIAGKRMIILIGCFLPVLIIPLGLYGLERLRHEIAQGMQVSSPLTYALTQLNVLLTYLRLLIFPVEQNLDYDYPLARNLFEFPTLISFVIFLTIIVCTLFLLKRKKLFSFGILWFLITLAPQSSFFPLRDAIFEHRLYLSSFGFALSAVLILLNFLGWRKMTVVMIAVSCLLAVLTFQRNAVWSDPLFFLKDVVRKSPQKARPHHNLGFFYAQRGNLQEAQREFQRALELDPGNVRLAYNLGMIYLRENQLEKAENLFRRLIQDVPEYPDPYTGLALTLKRQDQLKEAIKYFQEAIMRDPFQTAALMGMGNISQENRDFEKAEEYFKEVIQLKPEDALSYYNLGNLYYQKKQWSEAEELYLQALKRDPGLARALNNLGLIYFSQHKNINKASYYFRQAVYANPLLADAYFNFANSLYALGRPEEAHRMAATAVRLYRQQNKIKRAETIEKILSRDG